MSSGPRTDDTEPRTGPDLAAFISVLACMLGQGRRTGALPVAGERGRFGTDLSTVYAPLGRRAPAGLNPSAVLTAGIALQCAPTKELLAGLDADAVGRRAWEALRVAEGRAAMGWAIARWPALGADLALLAPGHDPMPDVEELAGLLALADGLLAEAPPAPVPDIFGDPPRRRAAGGRAQRRSGGGPRHARVPLSTKRARQRLQLFDMPVAGPDGEQPRLTVLEEAPDEHAPSSTAQRRIGLPYPEWDYRLGRHRENHVTVLERRIAPVTAASAALDPALARWFAAHLSTAWERRLEAGDMVDVAAYVDHVTAQRAGRASEGRIYQALRPRARDVSTAVLIDATSSLQTRGGAAFQLEVACCDALSLAMAGTGERFAVFAFTGETRHRVEVLTLREFADPTHLVAAPNAVPPSGYSRIGAALRHVTARLLAAPGERKVLMSIGDGRPSDEAYEGTYAEQDVCHAVDEATEAGVVFFHIGVGAHRADALERTFGSGRFHHLAAREDLPRALSRVHQELIAQ